MNGVHDMGGMHGMGPIRYEKNEPVFHAALGRARVWLTRGWEPRGLVEHRRLPSRIENLPPAEYLRMSYYEKWFAGSRAGEAGLVTRAEIETGKPAPGRPRLCCSRRRRSPRCSIGALGDDATSRSPRGSSWASACAPATCIRRPHAAAALRARQDGRDRSRPWRVSSSRTPTHIFLARSRSTFTRCGSRRASCGAIRPHRAIPSISTCGTTTLSQSDISAERLRSRLCRTCRATQAGRCSPSPGRRRHSRSR